MNTLSIRSKIKRGQLASLIVGIIMCIVSTLFLIIGIGFLITLFMDKDNPQAFGIGGGVVILLLLFIILIPIALIFLGVIFIIPSLFFIINSVILKKFQIIQDEEIVSYIPRLKKSKILLYIACSISSLIPLIFISEMIMIIGALISISIYTLLYFLLIYPIDQAKKEIEVIKLTKEIEKRLLSDLNKVNDNSEDI